MTDAREEPRPPALRWATDDVYEQDVPSVAVNRYGKMASIDHSNRCRRETFRLAIIAEPLDLDELAEKILSAVIAVPSIDGRPPLVAAIRKVLEEAI